MKITLPLVTKPCLVTQITGASKRGLGYESVELIGFSL